MIFRTVSIPSEFTLLSNRNDNSCRYVPCFNTLWIYTALKLCDAIHHVQWVSIPSEFTLLSNQLGIIGDIFKFQYPLNLHCSQTLNQAITYTSTFQYPLNLHCSQTAFSSSFITPLFQYPLNLHCSQTKERDIMSCKCFNTLWIYTALKQQKLYDSYGFCFNTLWIYTALKQRRTSYRSGSCFNTLWIYTALKHHDTKFDSGLQFQYPLNLHCSQTGLQR